MSTNAHNGKTGENSPKFGEYVMTKQRVPVESGDFRDNGEHSDILSNGMPIPTLVTLVC